MTSKGVAAPHASTSDEVLDHITLERPGATAIRTFAGAYLITSDSVSYAMGLAGSEPVELSVERRHSLATTVLARACLGTTDQTSRQVCNPRRVLMFVAMLAAGAGSRKPLDRKCCLRTKHVRIGVRTHG